MPDTTPIHHPIDAALLDAVLAAARDAGRAILEVYDTDFDVQRKADASPLTQADLASHRLLTARLAELTPGVPVLSEESPDHAYERRAGWRRFWLVDPLDGTKEFVKRNGEFTVNVALIEDDTPVLGVVTVPVTGVGYAAAEGLGAFGSDPDGNRRPLRTETPDADAPLRVAVSRSHADGPTAAVLERLERDWTVERLTSGSSIKICLVAEGRAHVYPRLGPTSEWDTAAAQCIVEQAGGGLYGLDGAPLRYNKRSLLNPHFLVSHGAATPWLDYLGATP